MTKETKPFNLELAIAGHPLVTRDGRDAKFIAYVPETWIGSRVIALLLNEGKHLLHFYESGNLHEYTDSESDLFLAPLGHCEGKPVFAGDELVNNSSSLLCTVEVFHTNFTQCTWPKPERSFIMTASQFVELAGKAYNKHYSRPVESFNDHAKQILTEWLDRQENKQ